MVITGQPELKPVPCCVLGHQMDLGYVNHENNLLSKVFFSQFCIIETFTYGLHLSMAFYLRKIFFGRFLPEYFIVPSDNRYKHIHGRI